MMMQFLVNAYMTGVILSCLFSLWIIHMGLLELARDLEDTEVTASDIIFMVLLWPLVLLCMAWILLEENRRD